MRADLSGKHGGYNIIRYNTNAHFCLALLHYMYVCNWYWAGSKTYIEMSTVYATLLHRRVVFYTHRSSVVGGPVSQYLVNETLSSVGLLMALPRLSCKLTSKLKARFSRPTNTHSWSSLFTYNETSGFSFLYTHSLSQTNIHRYRASTHVYVKGLSYFVFYIESKYRFIVRLYSGSIFVQGEKLFN